MVEYVWLPLTTHVEIKYLQGKIFLKNLHNSRLVGALRERGNFIFGNWIDGEVINQDEEQRKRGRIGKEDT